MEIKDLKLSGLKLLTLRYFHDDRGFFVERFNSRSFVQAGLPNQFLQDNHSRSKPRVLRGLHFQHNPPQGKLVGCIRGAVWDVAVDLRSDSPTFGQWQGVELTEDNRQMIWIPAGFAHGFCVLGDRDADVIYKVDSLYNASGESCLKWNDSSLGISWPIPNPILSAKDDKGGSFSDYKNSELAKSGFWRMRDSATTQGEC